jgi:hypothetical protein
MFFRHTNIITSCCSCSNVIGVKPTRGYIEVNQHQVFVVKLALTDVNLYHQIVYFKLNDSVKNTQVRFKQLHSVLFGSSDNNNNNSLSVAMTYNNP